MKIGTIFNAFLVEKTLRKFYFRLIMPIGCDSSPLGSKILFTLLSSHTLTFFALTLILSISRSFSRLHSLDKCTYSLAFSSINLSIS